MSSQRLIPDRAPALFFIPGMVIGFCLARGLDPQVEIVLLIAIFMAVVSLLTKSQHNIIWLLSFLVASTLCFWVYGAKRQLGAPDLEKLNRPIREAEVSFVVKQVMQERSQYGYSTGIAKVVEASKTSRLDKGSLIFFSLKLPQSSEFILQRGSELSATGVLEPILPSEDLNSFETYLKNSSIHYRFERSSRLKLIRPPPRFDLFCQKMNMRFQDSLRLGAPEGYLLEKIYIAMLLGQKAELIDDQKKRYRMSGTMHFFAISGLHIGVIATVIAQFLILVRVPRRVSPFIGLPLLYLYVEITGASPSAVRAFLMALFFWASFAFTRQRSPMSALAASAVCVLIFMPEQLWSIGFQLSYTVVLSILLLGLPLYELISKRWAPFQYLPVTDWMPWQRAYAWIQDAVCLLFAISLSAWMSSALLSAAFFGYLSPGAILLNMLLVNLAAISISTGVISLSLGLVNLDSVALFINHTAWLTIYAMDSLVAWSTQLHWMVVHFESFPKWLAYTGLTTYFVLLFYLQGKQRYNRAYLFFLPPSIIILTLLFGLV